MFYRTPLHLAALNGHLLVVKYLVKHKANINSAASDVHLFFLETHLFIWPKKEDIRLLQII